ncbi:MFS transporter, DHA1 family, multidrug resistance protein [Exophiala aquamarina CBS 119918]|uniref:MFS transporter, DHA1 family, multidrug resistance protein n=1 Tax=Exophiala aquamarina CBS 119918 TaxID=1182545 RepID=A0A072PAX3_9EURO|nr:MFS transporter, DHA1 family, multidrug resistance protein [Exophiala aquamarina CBS 119918]KEF57026.1 MFS transporter, DHA1 family, multidrug resistance protein [Exophiala aquamarina CBS 119918]
MDIVDRDMERAEVMATRTYSQESKARRSLRSQRSHQSVSSSSGSSTSTDADVMGRIATASAASLGRTRTHPVEDHRTETHRLQHIQTVGASTKSRPDTKPLPEFGGGKPYPPALPEREEYVVEFDGKDDPLHPQNWPFSRKLYLGAILAYTCLCSTFTSSVFSASTTTVARVFGIGLEVATLSTSLYVLGYAFGPLVWGPFSELQGRKLPILVGMFGFSIFNFGCAAAKDIQTVMLCRFFTGLFGSCPLAVVAAVFADMFDNTQRGPAVVIFSAMVFMGPMLGPFIGGFINASYLGWRWNVYLPGIMGSASFLLNLFFLKESYAPVVLVSKAAELRRRTKNWGIHAKQEEVEVDFRELVTKNFSRPLRLLVSEPIILAITIYMSFIYGLLYLFLTAYPLVFAGVHGFKPGVSGLPFFGMVVGIFIVAAYIIFTSKQYNKKLEANGGIPVPEWRLPPVMIGGVLFALGLFWFGWGGYKRSVHWIVPTLSGLFTGFGLLAIFIQCFNYLIDSYLMFAASAIAANTFLRSITAAGFPLFARQMFDGMGIEWASTLLGCFAFLLVPIPVLFYLYGAKLRAKSKFAPTMAIKKPADEEESSSDDEMQMAALHATRSRAHHDLNTGRSRTRTRTNASAGAVPSATIPSNNTNSAGAEKNA